MYLNTLQLQHWPQTPLLGKLTVLPRPSIAGGEGAGCHLPKNLIPRSRPLSRASNRYSLLSDQTALVP